MERAQCCYPLKDQASCGSCWAFSAVGALEGANAGNLVAFSWQHLVDCDNATANEGCNDGNAVPAFDYWGNTTALTEVNNPYTGLDGTCQNGNFTHTKVKTTGFTSVVADDPDAIKWPCFTAIKGLNQSKCPLFPVLLQWCFNNTKCGTYHNHATLVVGWGIEAGFEYWIMKNSWGVTWGEQGYMRL